MRHTGRIESIGAFRPYLDRRDKTKVNGLLNRISPGNLDIIVEQMGALVPEPQKGNRSKSPPLATPRKGVVPATVGVDPSRQQPLHQKVTEPAQEVPQ